MSVYDIEINSLEGAPGVLADRDGGVTLVVNVASRCGLTPQYAGLQALQDRYGDRDFAVVGVPCNQFLEQEPGTAEEIRTFCSTTYNVTFPITEKIEVNGDGRHPLYAALTPAADAEGHTGDVRWNFEKFLVDADGNVVGRFGPQIQPDADELVGAIEKALAT